MIPAAFSAGARLCANPQPLTAKKRFGLAGAAGCWTVCLSAAAYAQAPSTPEAGQADQVQAVVVVGHRAEVDASVENRSFAIDKDLNAANGSIADALRNLPSVSVDLDGNLTLRGDGSVQILIDGKPSTLFSGPARGQALLSYPAKNVARVELNTSPSAAYGAEGIGGIINLISAKPASGAMGAGSVSLQASSMGDTRASLTYAIPLGRLKLSASASTSRDLVKVETDSRRSALVDGLPDPLVTAARTASHSWTQQNLGDLRADYAATPRDQVTAELSLADFKLTGAERLSQQAQAGSQPPSMLESNGARSVKTSYWALDANWTHAFDGPEHDLAFAVSTGRSGQSNLADRNLTDFDPALEASAEHSLLSQVIRQTQSSVVYRRPLPGAAKLRLGLERDTDDDGFTSLLATGPTAAGLVVDSGLSNRFAFQQAIDAAFVTYERPFGKLTAQAGLRAETVDMAIGQGVGQIQRRLHGLYPTLNATYQLDEQSSLLAGFSRRVQRPIAARLNPFLAETSPISFQQGNPYLDPQQTNGFEVGYQHREGASYQAATVYWRDGKGEIASLTQDLGNGATLVRPANIVSSRTGGLELIANGRLSAKLSYRANATLFWKAIDAAPAAGIMARQGVGASANATLDWTVTPSDTVQINGVLVGRTLSAQGYQQSYQTVNLGWRRRFNDRVALTLSVRDVFNASARKQVLQTERLTGFAQTEQLARAVTLQLAFALGGGRRNEPAFDYSVPQAPGN